jgi:hypothetical protein
MSGDTVLISTINRILICPYTRKKIKNPVIDSLGNTYDKDAPQHADNSTVSNRVIADIIKLGDSINSEKIRTILKCPISQDCISYAVVNLTGISYDQTTLLEWLKIKETDPMTATKLTAEMLRPNNMVNQIISIINAISKDEDEIKQPVSPEKPVNTCVKSLITHFRDNITPLSRDIEFKSYLDKPQRYNICRDNKCIISVCVCYNYEYQSRHQVNIIRPRDIQNQVYPLYTLSNINRVFIASNFKNSDIMYNGVICNVVVAINTDFDNRGLVYCVITWDKVIRFYTNFQISFPIDVVILRDGNIGIITTSSLIVVAGSEVVDFKFIRNQMIPPNIVELIQNGLFPISLEGLEITTSVIADGNSIWM